MSVPQDDATSHSSAHDKHDNHRPVGSGVADGAELRQSETTKQNFAAARLPILSQAASFRCCLRLRLPRFAIALRSRWGCLQHISRRTSE